MESIVRFFECYLQLVKNFPPSTHTEPVWVATFASALLAVLMVFSRKSHSNRKLEAGWARKLRVYQLVLIVAITIWLFTGLKGLRWQQMDLAAALIGVIFLMTLVVGVYCIKCHWIQALIQGVLAVSLAFLTISVHIKALAEQSTAAWQHAANDLLNVTHVGVYLIPVVAALLRLIMQIMIWIARPIVRRAARP